MRICSPHCGISPESNSGGEVYERELLTRLGQDGVEVELLLARGKSHPASIPNWRVHRFPIRRGLKWYIAPAVVPWSVGRVWRRRGFDLLRIHSLRFMGPSVFAAKRLYGIRVPVVGHHHHLDANPLNRLIERRVVDACDRVIVGSEFSRRQLRDELGCRIDHVDVVPYGVNTETFAPRPPSEALIQRYGLDKTGSDRHGKPTVVLYFGGLKSRKNLEVLLDVWARIMATAPSPSPRSRLLIAGSGPQRKALEVMALRLGIHTSVVFTGYIPEREKAAHFNLADIFISPSALEGFGFTIAEAMASGLPIIASDRGSIPELVQGGGFLCNPAQPSDVASKLGSLLRHPELRREFGVANRARVERDFQWHRCVRATRRIYEAQLNPGR